MPDFTYVCPHCGQKYECNESWIGAKIKCQSCGKESVVRMPEINTRIASNTAVGKSKKAKNGCLLWIFATSPLFFGILVGCGNLDRANWSIPIGLILTIIFSFCAVVASIEDAQQKKNTAIFFIVLSVVASAIYLYFCIRDDKHENTQSNAQSTVQSNNRTASNSNITKSQVISETKKALELAQQVSGVTATGFHADNVLIGTDKATCHFTCFVKGQKHIGGMEFRISGTRLIPTGQYYLDPD